MIDLHVHTTASDGRASPRDIVARAVTAGLTVLAVTDHDTVAAVDEVVDLGGRAGIRVVPGIEISAAWDGHDVHVLGYFFDPRSSCLARFLAAQRVDRLRRVRAIAARLADLGAPVDLDPLVAASAKHPDRSVGRPQVARALVAAGHAVDSSDAFDRFLGEDCPAYVPREGPSPEGAIEVIRGAGGLAALAHPGVLQHDEIVSSLVGAGLAALEVHHPDHSAEQVARYSALATELGLEITGGSDYHGDPGYGAPLLGAIGLPRAAFARLVARVGARGPARTAGRPVSPGSRGGREDR